MYTGMLMPWIVLPLGPTRSLLTHSKTRDSRLRVWAKWRVILTHPIHGNPSGFRVYKLTAPLKYIAWGIWKSSNIPKDIFYLLEGDDNIMQDSASYRLPLRARPGTSRGVPLRSQRGHSEARKLSNHQIPCQLMYKPQQFPFHFPLSP